MSSYGVEKSSRREETSRRDDSSRHNDAFGRDDRDYRNSNTNDTYRDDYNRRGNRDSRDSSDNRRDSYQNSAPFVSNPYGPNNRENMPAMLPNEGKKEWRARVRSEMEMRICVWPRSPSPPKQKNKPVAKVVPVKKEKENLVQKHSSSKSKKSDKSEKSSKKDKSGRTKSDRPEKPERSDDQNNSDNSDNGDNNSKDRSVHFDPKEESRADMVVAEDAKYEMQKALQSALGLNEYERAETEGFRRDVQGNSIHSCCCSYSCSN